MLDRIKTLRRDQLGLPTWVVLSAVGFASHVVLNLILKKPVTSGWGLLAPLTLGVAIEAYEIWLQYRGIGLLAEGNDPLLMIFGRDALDVVVMLALPVLIAVGARLSTR